MNEKHKTLLDFFNNNDIELPISVKNSLQDVFDENSNIEKVDIYFKDDYELLGTELKVINNIKVYVDKPSIGTAYNVFTYYGDVEYSVSENVSLFKGEKLIETITNIDNQDQTTEVNSKEYAVIVFEKLEWKENEYTRTPKLIVYCPEILDED